MKTEKIVLSFIAVLIGVLVAAAAFYLYQSTKIVKTSQIKQATEKVTPTPAAKPTFSFSVETPTEGKVVDKRAIQLSGKANSDAILVVSTDDEDKIVVPTISGTFTTTVNLTDGENLIRITAFLPNGQETTIKKVVTFTSESF